MNVMWSSCVDDVFDQKRSEGRILQIRYNLNKDVDLSDNVDHEAIKYLIIASCVDEITMEIVTSFRQ